MSIKLSATRINSFLRCKYSYWLRYNTDTPVIRSDAFKLGTACHSALELAGNIWKENGCFSEEDVQKILKKYNQTSIKERISDIELHNKGMDLVKNRVYNWKTSAKSKIIGVEYKFGFDKDKDYFSPDGVPLIGAIDKLEEHDKDTLIIVDYKTSKTAPTVDSLRTDIQLSLYDLVASYEWPQYKRIILALDLLETGTILYTYRTSEERENFRKYLVSIYEAMSSFKEEDAAQEINLFCGWCDFKTSCKSYNDLICNKKFSFKPIVDVSIDELYSEWQLLKNSSKTIENRLKELDMYLIEKIKVENKNIVVGDDEVYVRQNSRVSYDLSDVIKIIPSKDIHKVVSVNQKSLLKYADDNPTVKEMVESVGVVNFTKPFLANRKIKK